MSRHTYQTQYQGHPTQIVMGYDRALNGFFMDISQKRPVETIPIYASSSDHALHGSFGMSESLDHFLAKLSELSLAVPSSMLTDVQQDAIAKAGNLVKDHSTSSAHKPKITHPIKIGTVDGACVYAACYPNGRLAIYLSGGRSDRVTINVPSVDLPENEVLVKMAGETAQLRDQLLGMGVLKDTGLRHQVGFDALEQWQVMTDFGGKKPSSVNQL